jgi:hypothetical protein
MIGKALGHYQITSQLGKGHAHRSEDNAGVLSQPGQSGRWSREVYQLLRQEALWEEESLKQV